MTTEIVDENNKTRVTFSSIDKDLSFDITKLVGNTYNDVLSIYYPSDSFDFLHKEGMPKSDAREDDSPVKSFIENDEAIHAKLEAIANTGSIPWILPMRIQDFYGKRELFIYKSNGELAFICSTPAIIGTKYSVINKVDAIDLMKDLGLSFDEIPNQDLLNLVDAQQYSRIKVALAKFLGIFLKNRNKEER